MSCDSADQSGFQLVEGRGVSEVRRDRSRGAVKTGYAQQVAHVGGGKIVAVIRAPAQGIVLLGDEVARGIAEVSRRFSGAGEIIERLAGEIAAELKTRWRL